MSLTDSDDLLGQIGFNSMVSQARDKLAEVPGVLGRVVEHSRSNIVIDTGSQSHVLRINESTRVFPLIVGDWVLADSDENDHWHVVERLAPYTQIHRVEPSGARQPLVSNVDHALLVMGLDEDFNLRRLERFIVLSKSAGVLPVVVLTKADVCTDLDVFLDLLAQRLPSSIERYAIDATDPNSIECLMPYVGRGQTAVMLGSSGAGKSTLTNTLTQAFTQSTAAVRESDGRGRHTTTGRHLRRVPGGRCVIDTPGLRGLRLDIDPHALHESFDDIAGLAERCRFRDCAHENETGCAVRNNVASDRIANYHKLCREISRDRADSVARKTAKAQVKSQQRALRALQKARGDRR